jgi:DNA polymerase-3 subunit epsilon
MLNKNLVIFDVETTGLDPQADFVVELCAVKYDQNLEKIGTYLQRFNVPIDIPKEVSDIHGITNEDLVGYPIFSEEIHAITDFFSGCDVGGYNVLFDVKFLAGEFAYANKPMITDFKIIDIMKVFAKYEPRTLSAVYKRLIGSDLDDAHSAEADVIATGAILKELINRGFCKLDTEELEQLSDTANLADYAGKFTKDKDGKLLWNFGKYFGKPVETDFRYCQWVMTTDIPAQSKNVLKDYLRRFDCER